MSLLRTCSIAVLLSCCAEVRLARAQEAFPLTEDPVLASLVAEALERSPDLRSAEASLAAARARIPQASALPDPMVSVGYENGGEGLALGSDPDTGLGVTVSQAFPFPGKRRLAERVEAKDAERTEQDVVRTRRRLVFRIRLAYAGLLLARENLALIDEQRRATRDIEELTRSRYAVGLAGQSDVLRPQAELARLDQMQFHEEGNEVSALAELNALLGRAAGTPVPPGRRLTSLAEVAVQLPTVEEVVAHAERMSPHVIAARLAVERSEAALDLARRNRKPDFVASGAYVNRGSLPAMWKLDFGIQVPLYAGRKQGRAVAEAEARLRAAQAGLEAERLRVRSTAEKNLAELRAAVREAQAYSRGVLVVDGLAVESALASYQAGKVPFVSVLEAFGTRYKDRWEYTELLYHVLWHSASLDQYGAGE